MTRGILATALLAGAASWAAADEVWLKGGGRIVGEVMERSPETVLVDVGPGTIRVPMERVDRIVGASSRLAEFRARAGRLAEADVAGWLALAAWADQNDLRTQARGAWEHVLSIEPGNVTAQRALGNVLHAGLWMARNDALRAQGMVEFQGQWMTPAEREARLQEQATEAIARREAVLAEARIAEAEARAREAEARAAAAEADAARAADYDDGGIPFGIAYGGGYPIDLIPPVQPCCGGGRRGGHGHGHGPRLDPGRTNNQPHTPPQRDNNSSPTITPVTRSAGPEKRGGGKDN